MLCSKVHLSMTLAVVLLFMWNGKAESGKWSLSWREYKELSVLFGAENVPNVR